MQLTRLLFVERKSFGEMDCSIAQCLEVVGEWWSLLILRDAFMGVSKFDVFQRRLGISRNILQQRLERLVEERVLTKSSYSEHPPRFDYRLTDKGRDLWPVINAMRQWGDHYAAPNGPPVVMMHTTCGEQTSAVLVCDHCGEPMDLHTVRVKAGKHHDPSVIYQRKQSSPAR
jgi:DNA-binding HxlR family transcriptional regulator